MNFLLRWTAHLGQPLKSAFLLFGSALAFAGCARQSEPTLPERTATPEHPLRNFATTWQNETEYIVASVSADLVAMTSHAGRTHTSSETTVPATATLTPQPRPGTEDPSYDCEVLLSEALPLHIPISSATGVWNPDTYSTLAEALLKHIPASASADSLASTELNLTELLLNPTPKTLCEADALLSRDLANSLASPTAHERAALLIGSFALREASGKFFEVRHELNRMTAHLALANALQRDRQRSQEGLLASAILAALSNDQVSALEILERLPAEDAALASWSRSLRMRITHDFRIGLPVEQSTLLEQREAFRATVLSLPPDPAMRRFEHATALQSTSDWWRIINLKTPSVGVGHELLRSATQTELHECIEIYRACIGTSLKPDRLVDALNTSPSGCISSGPGGRVSPLVLGWTMWAASLQRHLCHSITKDFDFIANRWGLPDQAATYRSSMDQAFGNLRLYPLVRRQNATEEGYYRSAQDATMRLIRSMPHVVPARAWNDVCEPISGCPRYIPPPHAFVNEWHWPNPPPGTAYDLAPRFFHPSLTKGPHAAQRIQRLVAMAPYDEIAIHYAHIAGKTCSPDQVAEAYGPLMDYKVHLMLHVASLCGKSPEAETWLMRAAPMEPAAYRVLATLYVDLGREEHAVAAYEAWLKSEPDSVSKSVNVAWLIKYYEQHGRCDEATALADEAAEVYSFGGLEAKAGLLEMREAYPGAHEYYRRISKRYGDPGPLFGFCYRYKAKTGRPDFDDEYDQLARRLVPGGLHHFDADTQAAPTKGVFVQTDQRSEIKSVGLVKGDVIVSARGLAVADWLSFKTIRALDPDHVIAVTVWRNANYVVLPPLPAGHRFGVDLTDYKPNR